MHRGQLVDEGKGKSSKAESKANESSWRQRGDCKKAAGWSAGNVGEVKQEKADEVDRVTPLPRLADQVKEIHLYPKRAALGILGRERTLHFALITIFNIYSPSMRKERKPFHR